MPQIGGMHEGDRSRKQTLVDYGFRLPSALDNRPQTFDEFLSITPQMVFVSATPGDYERSHSPRIVEQIVRPTGVVDPHVEVRETRNQIDDLMNECRLRVERNERVLVTTLTKKMSEDLTDYLLEMGFKVRYLHSEVDTLERIQIIRDLRLGEYDVLVGVNLLREGLDLPEVSLVAILDADKEGFLRGETSLIQTIGRAARNIEGTVLMYADKETAAMRAAIGETDRRRAIQLAYNEEHGITAATIVKGISDIAEFLQAEGKTPKGRRRSERRRAKAQDMSLSEIEKTIIELEEEMLAAADDLRFEYAARLRDEIRELRRELVAMREYEAPRPDRRRHLSRTVKSRRMPFGMAGDLADQHVVTRAQLAEDDAVEFAGLERSSALKPCRTTSPSTTGSFSPSARLDDDELVAHLPVLRTSNGERRTCARGRGGSGTSPELDRRVGQLDRAAPPSAAGGATTSAANVQTATDVRRLRPPAGAVGPPCHARRPRGRDRPAAAASP